MRYNRIQHPVLLPLLGLLFIVAGCAPVVNQHVGSSITNVDPAFQNRVSPVPTPASYRCGAWTSNNAPGSYSTITVYARLTHDTAGVDNALASGVVHFATVDTPLGQKPASDRGGYVHFSLALQGRQPGQIPATIDVSFQVPGQREKVSCAPAFFTPQ